MQLVRHALSLLLNVLAPPACVACDAPCAAVFCPACAELVPSDASEQSEPSEIDGLPLAVVGRYAPPLSTAITRFKYEGRAELGPRLAGLLQSPLATALLTPGTTLVPVPLHPRRLADRGYNQAAVLAAALARQYGLADSPRLLTRRRETARQVGKNREERLANARNAFVVRERSGRNRAENRVILVDDVVTTGATVRACAQALRQGGIELAGVLALARANGD